MVLCLYLEDLVTLSPLPRTPTLDLLHVITMLIYILGTNEGRRSKSRQQTGGSVGFAQPPSDDLVLPAGSFSFIPSISIF